MYGIAEMILIKMDKLTDSELKNIAQDECIEDFDSLSREELIQALTEKYEDMDSNFSPEEQDDLRNLRYFAGITDYRGISDYVDSLPGVEDLPDTYPNTSIYLLNKNNNWAYAFWSISLLDSKKIEANGSSLILHITKKDKNGHIEQYDIPIKESDSEWNIGLSMMGGFCIASIIAVSPNGDRDVLATSNQISQIDCYLLQHEDEMADNDSLCKVYLSLITTRDGALIENDLVKEIVNAYEREDRDE